MAVITSCLVIPTLTRFILGAVGVQQEVMLTVDKARKIIFNVMVRMAIQEFIENLIVSYKPYFQIFMSKGAVHAGCHGWDLWE